ncbi:MAG: pilus assembly protein [Phycisphaerae bacterium]|nr:pilus assembly protein [Phycisphaerae bacterium]
MRRNRKTRHARRAATAVELAVVAPLVMLFMCGAIETGYAFMIKQTIGLATNRAARAATLPGATSDDVISIVTEEMEKAGLSGFDIATNIDELGPTERQVWVEVSIPLHRVLFTGKLLGGESFALSAKKTANREMSPVATSW